MEDDIFLLALLGSVSVISLVSAILLSRKFPYFNFLEWLGTVFLLLAWYSLFIPTTLAILVTGQWVNEMQLAGFIAADLAPLGVLYWSISKRRKAYQSRLPA